MPCKEKSKKAKKKAVRKKSKAGGMEALAQPTGDQEMKLFSVKRPKKKSGKAMEVPSDIERERYPWGLRLTFEKEDIAKVKVLQNIAVGAKVNVQATGKVVSVRTSDNEDERKRHTVEIQIQKVGVAARADSEAAWKLSPEEFKKWFL